MNHKYGYDVRTIYKYPAFSNEIGHLVNIGKTGFLLPDMKEDVDTVLLEFDVRSTLLGMLESPFIEASFNGYSIFQFFEHGVCGKRYLNISPFAALISGSNRFISLKGHRISWKPHEARLLCFRNQSLKNKSVLVISPHPDDAEIAAYGLYETAKSTIVTITAGEGGRDLYGPIVHDQKESFRLKGETRAWNSVTVPQLAGVASDRAVNLGYFDCTLEDMFKKSPNPVVSNLTGIEDIRFFRRFNKPGLLDDLRGKATWPNLVADLKDIILKVRPDIVVAPHPFLDSHRDHQMAFIAISQAVREVGFTECSFYLYVIHNAVLENYPFGHCTSLASLPPCFRSNLLFESLYSHPLTELERARKLVALDSMSDLRPKLMQENNNPLLQRLLSKFGLCFHSLTDYYYSIFARRRSRINELFFVYSSNGAATLETQLIDLINAKNNKL